MRGHPITLNHYFTENLQKKRNETYRREIAKKLGAFFKIDMDRPTAVTKVDKYVDMQELLNILCNKTEASMDRFACMEATSAMEAYYKVALKSIIDSFSIYAVEECLLKELANLFEPQSVLELEDSVISQIAGESAESLAEREELSKKLKVLEMTMTTMRRMKNFEGPGADDSVGRGLPSGEEPSLQSPKDPDEGIGSEASSYEESDESEAESLEQLELGHAIKQGRNDVFNLAT